MLSAYADVRSMLMNDAVPATGNVPIIADQGYLSFPRTNKPVTPCSLVRAFVVVVFPRPAPASLRILLPFLLTLVRTKSDTDAGICVFAPQRHTVFNGLLMHGVHGRLDKLNPWTRSNEKRKTLLINWWTQVRRQRTHAIRSNGEIATPPNVILLPVDGMRVALFPIGACVLGQYQVRGFTLLIVLHGICTSL